MNKQTLLYLTQLFPYPGEAFPEDELPILSQLNWQIIVLPCGQYHGKQLPIPLPTHVRSDFRLLGHPLAKLFSIFTLTGLRLLWQEWRHRYKNGLAFSWIGSIKACASAAFIQKKIRQIIWEYHLESSPLVIYSFWFSYHSMAIPMLRQEFPQVRYVSRAHNIDIYQDRHAYGHLPFYSLRAMTADILAPCSHHGMESLLAEGVPSERLITAYLGVPPGPICPCPPSPRGELILVSCSYMLPVKRIKLLVRLLGEFACQRPQLRITWHHLGDGPEAPAIRDAVKQQLCPLNNIIPVLHGQLTPKEVRSFLSGAQGPLDGLVNVSSMEGLPVSMMEALAAGLPIVGPDVGGVSEIITDKTGVLLPATCDIQAFIHAIDLLSEWKQIEKRRYNQAFFVSHFQMDINYRSFAEDHLASQFSISNTLLSHHIHKS